MRKKHSFFFPFFWCKLWIELTTSP